MHLAAEIPRSPHAPDPYSPVVSAQVGGRQQHLDTARDYDEESHAASLRPPAVSLPRSCCAPGAWLQACELSCVQLRKHLFMPRPKKLRRLYHFLLPHAAHGCHHQLSGSQSADTGHHRPFAAQCRRLLRSEQEPACRTNWTKVLMARAQADSAEAIRIRGHLRRVVRLREDGTRRCWLRTHLELIRESLA